MFSDNLGTVVDYPRPNTVNALAKTHAANASNRAYQNEARIRALRCQDGSMGTDIEQSFHEDWEAAGVRPGATRADLCLNSVCSHCVTVFDQARFAPATLKLIYWHLSLRIIP